MMLIPVTANAISASGLALTWVSDWASWRLQPPHQAFVGHGGSVSSVAVGQLDGRTIVVSGSGDKTVRVWDAATGAPVGDPLTGHTGWVSSVAVGQLDGRTIVVSGSDDGTVRVWDAVTGAPVGDPFTGHGGAVNAVAAGQVDDGRTIVISGELGDLALGEVSTFGSHASRRPGMRHRPYRSAPGCLMLEIRCRARTRPGEDSDNPTTEREP